jgi:hypothetical protein
VAAVAVVLAVAQGAQVILPLQVHCKLVAVTVEFVTVAVVAAVAVLEQLEPAVGMVVAVALPVTEPTVAVAVEQVAIQVMVATLVRGTLAQVMLVLVELAEAGVRRANIPLAEVELVYLVKEVAARAAPGPQAMPRVAVQVAQVRLVVLVQCPVWAVWVVHMAAAAAQVQTVVVDTAAAVVVD